MLASRRERGPASRARGAGVLALVAAALLPAAGPALSAPAAADTKGDWWYSALKIAQNTREADGSGVTIALLDTPVDRTIPELRGQRLEDGGSYCEDPLDKPYPAFLEGRRGVFHGTSMAALLVGNGKGTRPDGSGIRGVAPGATLRVYPVLDPREQEKGEFGCYAADLETLEAESYHELIPKALVQAVDDGADIVSMSFNSKNMDAAAEYAADRGVIMVASVTERINALTGKAEGFVGAPADAKGVIAVTAVDSKGRWWDGAAESKDVLVAAPGVDIGSGAMDERGRWSSDGLGTGTSPATAIVAGMLAVVKSKYPDATNAQIVQHLVRHTTTRPLKHDVYYGYGIVSLTNMLQADPRENPDDNPLLDDMLFGSVPPARRWTGTAPATPRPSTPAAVGVPSATGTPPASSPGQAPAAGASSAADAPSTAAVASSSGSTGSGSGTAVAVVLVALVAGGGAVAALLYRRRRPGGAPASTEGA
nr:S8/S53 family peptidase [Motilibacter deserti]